MQEATETSSVNRCSMNRGRCTRAAAEQEHSIPCEFNDLRET